MPAWSVSRNNVARMHLREGAGFWSEDAPRGCVCDRGRALAGGVVRNPRHTQKGWRHCPHSLVCPPGYCPKRSAGGKYAAITGLWVRSDAPLPERCGIQTRVPLAAFGKSGNAPRGFFMTLRACCGRLLARGRVRRQRRARPGDVSRADVSEGGQLGARHLF